MDLEEEATQEAQSQAGESQDQGSKPSPVEPSETPITAEPEQIAPTNVVHDLPDEDL